MLIVVKITENYSTKSWSTVSSHCVDCRMMSFALRFAVVRENTVASLASASKHVCNSLLWRYLCVADVVIISEPCSHSWLFSGYNREKGITFYAVLVFFYVLSTGEIGHGLSVCDTK